MTFTREQYQEYYQKRKTELNKKRTENRLLTRLRQLEVETTKEKEQVETAPNLETGLRQVETIQGENIGLRQLEVETDKKVGEVETPKLNNQVETEIKVETGEIKKEVETTKEQNIYNQKEKVETIIPTENKLWEKQTIIYNLDGTLKNKKWTFKNIDKAIEWIDSW